MLGGGGRRRRTVPFTINAPSNVVAYKTHVTE
jgi:hypothetical protein